MQWNYSRLLDLKNSQIAIINIIELWCIRKYLKRSHWEKTICPWPRKCELDILGNIESSLASKNWLKSNFSLLLSCEWTFKFKDWRKLKCIKIDSFWKATYLKIRHTLISKNMEFIWKHIEIIQSSKGLWVLW